MLTEFDIQRISRAVVDMLLGDDRFAKRMEKMTVEKAGKMMSVREAASLLGISVWTVRTIAPQLGGIKKGVGKQAKWAFEESSLKDRYMEYLQTKA